MMASWNTFKCDIKGVDELCRSLEKCKAEDINKVVKYNGAKLQTRMQENAKFRGHFEWVSGQGLVFMPPTGRTQGSISLQMTNNPVTAEVGAKTSYAPYLEFGTRKMSAQPFVERSLKEIEPNFINDLKTLVKKVK